MKKYLFAFTLIILGAGSTKAQTKAPDWKEQKQFHALMSGSFHPAEEGNFAPLKQKADSLLIVAKLWNASAIPSNYQPTKTKETLAVLVKNCSTLQQAVKENKTDAELKKIIAEAHDTFHKLVGECKKED